METKKRIIGTFVIFNRLFQPTMNPRMTLHQAFVHYGNIISSFKLIAKYSVSM